MSYPVVIVIIIITAVISYLIGIFDAKTTNKWFGKDNNQPKREPEVIIDASITRLALIQTNDQNEVFVEFDDSIKSNSFIIDNFNKRKLTELVEALGNLTGSVAPKLYIPEERPEPKEELALRRSLVQSAQKSTPKKRGAITDLVGLVNQYLEDTREASAYLLEIRENQAHELSFWVDEKGFPSVDEVEPSDAKEQFRKAIDSVNQK